MKCVLLFISLFAVTMAANQLAALVKHEVTSLLAKQPTLDVATCTNMCDAIFDLVDDTDEMLTDQMCSAECTRELVSTTHHPHHHSRPSHHTHHHNTATTPAMP